MAVPKVLVVEPPVPTTSGFTKVEHVQAVINDLDAGEFRRPAVLIERMLWNPRLRGVLNTRIGGAMAAEIRWEPARNTPNARRAAEGWRVDWDLAAPVPTRKQLAKWNLMLGLALGQRAPVVAKRSGRLIPVARPYWPGWARWDDLRKTYQVQTQAAEIDVPSLAVGGEIDPAESPWVVSEPFGPRSYREAIVHAAWESWLGRGRSWRDQQRASEKHGVGITKLKYPRGKGDDEEQQAVAEMAVRVRDMGRDGVVPLEQNAPNGEHASEDIEPFEFSGAGFAAIDSAMNACAVDMAILLLGHNLVVEVKGGSYAAASVGDYIRDDAKHDDAAAEWAWVGPQLVEVWAAWNYGDPDLAPRAVYVTDSPAVNKAAAETINQLSQSLDNLARHGVDVKSLCERFRLPLAVANRLQVQVPANGGEIQ